MSSVPFTEFPAPLEFQCTHAGSSLFFSVGFWSEAPHQRQTWGVPPLVFPIFSLPGVDIPETSFPHQCLFRGWGRMSPSFCHRFAFLSLFPKRGFIYTTFRPLTAPKPKELLCMCNPILQGLLQETPPQTFSPMNFQILSNKVSYTVQTFLLSFQNLWIILDSSSKILSF